jgi:hypothetical protein
MLGPGRCSCLRGALLWCGGDDEAVVALGFHLSIQFQGGVLG